MKTKGEGRIGRIGARSRLLTAVCTLCFSAAVFSSTVYAGTEGTWERTEDGKYWKYVYAPDRQAIDEWIEIDGKEYYFDKKGRMKTGWVTSEWDGNRYYMGKDGAKCRNTFLSNGTYIGPDGVVLERFEAWRKAVQNQLEQMVRAKTEGVFFLTDLNETDTGIWLCLTGWRIRTSYTWRPCGMRRQIRSIRSVKVAWRKTDTFI